MVCRIKEHTLSAEFARLFHAHPASIEDPGLALQSARETLSERHPGDEYETDDETPNAFPYTGRTLWVSVRSAFSTVLSRAVGKFGTLTSRRLAADEPEPPLAWSRARRYQTPCHPVPQPPLSRAALTT